MPNTPPALAPRSPGNRWAYWKVTDLRLAKLQDLWKRRRNPIDFIPTEEALAVSRAEHTCGVCAEQVTSYDASREGVGVRGVYSPRTRALTLWHYPCAWQRTFEAIVDMGTRMR